VDQLQAPVYQQYGVNYDIQNRWNSYNGSYSPVATVQHQNQYYTIDYAADPSLTASPIMPSYYNSIPVHSSPSGGYYQQHYTNNNSIDQQYNDYLYSNNQLYQQQQQPSYQISAYASPSVSSTNNTTYSSASETNNSFSLTSKLTNDQRSASPNKKSDKPLKNKTIDVAHRNSSKNLNVIVKILKSTFKYRSLICIQILKRIFCGFRTTHYRNQLPI
jgi:hypothetical protein